MPGGRPTLYAPELAEEICRRIALGAAVATIGRDLAMPCADTIWTWINVHDEFSDRYARAKRLQMDRFGEEIVAIADANEDDSRVDGEGEVRHDTDHIQRAKLRIDTRKWLMAKLAVKKYGDKSETTHTGTVGLTVNIHKGTSPSGD